MSIYNSFRKTFLATMLQSRNARGKNKLKLILLKIKINLLFNIAYVTPYTKRSKHGGHGHNKFNIIAKVK